MNDGRGAYLRDGMLLLRYRTSMNLQELHEGAGTEFDVESNLLIRAYVVQGMVFHREEIGRGQEVGKSVHRRHSIDS